MKTRLFLKTLSDTQPDSVSPRPPAGSQIQSTHQTHVTRPTGTQASQDRQTMASFSDPKGRGVQPGGFSLPNRFFTTASGPAGAPWKAGGGREDKGKKQSPRGKVFSLPVRTFPSPFHHFVFQGNEM